MSIASQGQPSKKVSIGPLVIHFLHPIHNRGSTKTRLNAGASGFSTSNMQLSTGHSVIQIGELAHPVQASLITASILGFLFRCTFLLAFSVVAMTCSLRVSVYSEKLVLIITLFQNNFQSLVVRLAKNKVGVQPLQLPHYYN